MTFVSLQFILFALTVVGGNWLLRERPMPRKWLLLSANAAFYAAWDWRFLVLVWATAAINHRLGSQIARSRSGAVRRRWLIASLVWSLGVLALFKYADFFIQGAASLLQAAGLHADLPTLRLVLPLGISFYTFQTLSYVIDVYRGQEEPCPSLLDFLIFSSFFATVSAGPITRARQLLPQLAAPSRPSGPLMEHGLALIVRGFARKVLFADVLAVWIVDPAFADPAAYAGWFLMLGLYAYTFQIYMDVAGYTDIARGAAAMCGFDLPHNFDRPYVARSVSNFWQRWHISMSGFFRDYLFFSLGGSRHGHVYLNLMITFLAIGFWHGAGWNFMLYGALHGGVVCLERWRRGRRAANGLGEADTSAVRQAWGWFYTFHFIVLSRVLFRAEDLPAAGRYLTAMLGGKGTAEPLNLLPMLSLVAAALLHWALPGAGQWVLQQFKGWPIWARACTIVGLFYVGVLVSVGGGSFVYFQF